jgi:hypothetical protein
MLHLLKQEQIVLFQYMCCIVKCTANVKVRLYRVIHKSVKHFKNSQQINYASDQGNSYAD